MLNSTRPRFGYEGTKWIMDTGDYRLLFFVVVCGDVVGSDCVKNSYLYSEA